MSWLRRFGAFWYDFVVGDSVVLAVGTVVALAVAAVLVRAGAGTAAPVALPLLVALTLAASLR